MSPSIDYRVHVSFAFLCVLLDYALLLFHICFLTFQLAIAMRAFEKFLKLYTTMCNAPLLVVIRMLCSNSWVLYEQHYSLEVRLHLGALCAPQVFFFL